jgi:hypothetical protein
MLNLGGIVVAILKMATGRNITMKIAFNLFFKPVVSSRFGRLHNR